MKGIGLAILLSFLILTPLGGAVICLIIWIIKGCPKKKNNETT